MTDISLAAVRRIRSSGHASLGLFSLNSGILLIVFCFLLGFIQLNAVGLLRDPDTFWHVRTGEWILDHRQILKSDLFSYTAYGNFWLYTDWLSDVIYATVFRVGGFPAVVLVTSICCAGMLTIVAGYLLSHIRFSAAIGWTVLTLVAVFTHLLARPHIFSYVILPIWLIVLIDSYESNNFGWRRLGQLILLIVLWSNLHGSFTLGLAFLYVFAGISFLNDFLSRHWQDCARKVTVVLLTSFASLLNPFGFQAAFATFEALHRTSTVSRIFDSMAPNFHEDQIHLVLFLALFAVILGIGTRLRGPNLITFLAITAMGLSYARGLIMFFLLSPILLAKPIAEASQYLRTRFLDPKNIVDAADPVLRFLDAHMTKLASLFVIIAISTTTSLFFRSNLQPPGDIAPRAALDFIRRENITGNVFNDYNFGGFLIAAHIPTFVDGRVFPFDDSFTDEYFKALSGTDPEKSFELLDRYKVEWALLLPDKVLTKALAHNAGWKQVYSDEYAVVIVRNTEAK